MAIDPEGGTSNTPTVKCRYCGAPIFGFLFARDGMGRGMGLLQMVLFWGVIIVAVVLVAKWLGGSNAGNAAPRSGTPLELLKERYARGEIGKDEFEQKKHGLGGRDMCKRSGSDNYAGQLASSRP